MRRWIPKLSNPVTEFLTGVSVFGTPRTDDGGPSGMGFTVGGAGITVRSLSRWTLSGNSGSHTLTLGSGSVGGAFTTLGSVMVNTSGQPAAQLLRGLLGSTVALSPSTQYFLFSTTSGGDAWYDNTGTTVITTTAVATCNGMYYLDGTTITAAVAVNNFCFGPLSFGY